MRHCRECGAVLSARRGTREFCDPICRRRFHHRHAQRGAALYSVVMALRFQRSEATKLKAFTLLSRLAERFRFEDLRDRDGRQSWTDLQEMRRRFPDLGAAVIRNRRGRRRHGALVSLDARQV